MGKPEQYKMIANKMVYVFFVSLSIFVLSLIPLSYGLGYSNGLAGAAGVTDPLPPQVGDENILNTTYLTVISGIVTLVSGLFASLMSLLKSRLEYITQKTELEIKKIEAENLRREMELALLQEKNEGRKKKKP